MLKTRFIALSILATLSLSAYSQEIVLKGKELFGDMRARQIGPALMSGRIIDLEGHPTDNRIIYVGSAGGGVWKSTNGGASFQPIFDENIQSIGKVKLDPKDPDNTVWVGTGEIWTRNSVSIGDGLYRSKDGGVNWKKMGFENSERISSIEIHPENTDIMYVGVLGALWSDNEERGVYKSEDGGMTWSKILYVDPKTGCGDVVMDPENPEILYASMWEFRRTAWSFNSGGENSALYKSTDGGKTWNKIHNGFPKGQMGRIAFAIAPSDSKILYAVLETEDETKRGLYKSEDAGASWKMMNGDFGLVVRPFYFSRIVVDPKDPNVVVKAGLYGSISRDGGKTFKSLGNMHSDIHDLLFDINDSDRLYAGTDGGLYRSWDKGTTMDIVDNLPLSQFYHISLDNDEPYNIYGGLQDNGSWYGPSNSPAGIEARDWNPVGYGDGFRVLRHPTKRLLYSEMQGAENIWRYDMDRMTQKTIQPLQMKGKDKLRFNWNAAMSLSDNNPDRLYVGSQYVHKSDDMGNTWKIISPDLTTNDPDKKDPKESGGISKDNSGAENHCTIFTIAESSLNENVIWVGTDDGNIQVTKNGGKSWDNVTDNLNGVPKNTWVYHIEASVHGEGTAYAVLEGHTSGDMNPYVYKTTDYGQTWTSIATDEIGSFVRNIQEDYENEDLLFLGTEVGLYITVNGGKNWSKFTNNMPAVAIHYMDLHKKTNDLVMGTHGRGIIILDDISPLRQINQEVLAENVYFFETNPGIFVEAQPFGGSSTELQFVGPNKNNDAQIIYYLKKKHIFGKMEMEIQTMDGQKLIEITPGKSKGINVVTWNGMIKQPKMAKGKTFVFGGFTSPRVQAGDYKVVMTKGKETYETTISYINDPKSNLTDEERQANYETTVQLYKMSEELAYMVYEMDQIIAKAEEVAASGKNKSANAILDDLTKLKETLVVTTGDNYVDSAEPQLRGKIASLYSKVASGFEPPSSEEMANLTFLKEQYDEAKADFDKIKMKLVPKMEKYMNSKGIADLQIKSYEEFIND